jgi:hypothetical protein
MPINDSVHWLRISYWVGAVADAVAAVVMLSQAMLAHRSPLTTYVPEVPYRYAMGLAGSLMLGWTLLLIWADRRPLERRGALLITNIVIVGLLATDISAVRAGFVSLASMAPLLVLQVLLLILFSASYVRAGRHYGA